MRRKQPPPDAGRLIHTFHVDGDSEAHHWSSVLGMVRAYQTRSRLSPNSAVAATYAARAIQVLQMLGRTEAAKMLLLEASLTLGMHAHLFKQAFNLQGDYDQKFERQSHVAAWLEQERLNPTWPIRE